MVSPYFQIGLSLPLSLQTFVLGNVTFRNFNLCYYVNTVYLISAYVCRLQVGAGNKQTGVLLSFCPKGQWQHQRLTVTSVPIKSLLCSQSLIKDNNTNHRKSLATVGEQRPYHVTAVAKKPLQNIPLTIILSFKKKQKKNTIITSLQISAGDVATCFPSSVEFPTVGSWNSAPWAFSGVVAGCTSCLCCA